METVKQVIAHYIPQGDHLYIHIKPKRPAAVSETDHDFYIRYDLEEQREIVGFECLDFSKLVPHIYDPKVVPKLDLRFDVESTHLRNVTLQEVLAWVYEAHIRKDWERQRAA